MENYFWTNENRNGHRKQRMEEEKMYRNRVLLLLLLLFLFFFLRTAHNIFVPRYRFAGVMKTEQTYLTDTMYKRAAPKTASESNQRAFEPHTDQCV